ncbi:Phosphatidylinositol 4-phosphate 3-kinase C2 domain-containing subunit alpha [Lamellibrachia satsuma]|nr:Phosphatidylinositol 4-phosphate 3-kinase C2 domain-containing subunit alpha [Lamellibrachia satsuma]
MSEVILGRTHVRSVAAVRKEAVETFIKHLFSLEPEISENDIVYTFFHPMLRDEQDIDKTNLQKLKEKPCMQLPDLDIQSQIKLSLFYKSNAFTVMVMHVKDLVVQGDEAPDPYVKLYLLPDPTKLTKRKTKIAKGTFHPTYNEMLIYRMPVDEVKERQLQVTVWSYDALKENEFLGAVIIDLSQTNLTRTTTQWHQLHMHR